MPVQACLACNSDTEHRLLYRKADCDILRCAPCGLGHAEAPAFDPSSYYTRAYFDGTHADGYANYVESEPVIRDEFRRTVEVVRRLKPTGGRLLEVGCAYGFFLLEAEPYFLVHGIELAADAVEHCHRRGLETVHCGGVSDAVLDRIAPIDVVVMLDVIEHLADPRAVLHALAARMSPGGILLLTTGDFGSPVARLTGKSWRLMTPPQHLWFFTERSLRGLAAAVGLETVAVSRPWKRVPLGLVAFQLQRMVGLATTPMDGAIARAGIPINLYDAMRVVLRKPG